MNGDKQCTIIDQIKQRLQIYYYGSFKEFFCLN